MKHVSVKEHLKILSSPNRLRHSNPPPLLSLLRWDPKNFIQDTNASAKLSACQKQNQENQKKTDYWIE